MLRIAFLVMLAAMHMIWDALWRAVRDGLQAKVWLWSLFPLVVVGVLAALLAGWWWSDAVQAVQSSLQQLSWLHWLWQWLDLWSLGAVLQQVLAVLLVLMLSGPLIIIVALLLVGWVMTPQMVALVARQRYPQLERRRGGSVWLSVVWALGSTLIALLALVLSMPLWLVPPLVLILPPLIWGWLTYRVMAFDALAEHASRQERRLILQEHRWHLLLMGVVCGYISAAPGLVWASGLVFVAAFWILIPLALWIYALVFAFSSLWFAHYGLAALAALRARNGTPSPDALP